MYNYTRLRASDYHLGEFLGPTVGEKAPNFEATTLSGDKVQLSDYFGKTIVLEVGSITCPMYIGKIRKMNRLARHYPDVQFLLLYVREAHPGSKIPAHQSRQDKLYQARRLQGEEAEDRTMLVDSLDGTAHEIYGGLPNMIYVIDPHGVIVSRSAWNNPSAVRAVLKKVERGEAVDTIRSGFVPTSPVTLLRVLL